MGAPPRHPLGALHLGSLDELVLGIDDPHVQGFHRRRDAREQNTKVDHVGIGGLGDSAELSERK